MDYGNKPIKSIRSEKSNDIKPDSSRYNRWIKEHNKN